MNYSHFEAARGELVRPAMRDRKIRYCIRIEDTQNFSEASIEIQLRTALNRWLEAVDDYLPAPVQLQWVSCRDFNRNLEIRVGADRLHRGLRAHHQTHFTPHHAYSVITLNTEYVIQSSGQWKFKVVDFLSFLPETRVVGLEQALYFISKHYPQTLFEFASSAGVDWIAVQLSSYPILLHELGHAFGLCDTYADQFSRCDPQFVSAPSSEAQPYSVMKLAMYFNLTEDDRQGIRARFKRFYRFGD